VGSGAGTITQSSQLDSAVALLAASGITTLLPQSTTQPPSLNALARYNSGGFYLQTRPTTVDYDVLLGTFHNDSGLDRGTIIIDYDLAGIVSSDATRSESSGLWGHRVYYSLTGAAGTWVHIPDLDTADGSAGGHKTATITPSSAWEVGANLYILWADDNGPDSDTANGPKEPAWTIDNLKIAFQTEPIAIVTQPHNATVEECRDTNFTVVVTGSSPVYQWFRNNSPIGGNSANLPITAAALSANNSDIFVRVSNTQGSVDSAHVKLFVQADNTRPTIDSAVAKINGTNVVVVFSEKMDPDPDNGAQATYSYLLKAPDGTTTSPATAVLAADGRTLTLGFEAARTPNVNYHLLVAPAMGDACKGNVLTGPEEDTYIQAPLKFEVDLISYDNSHWKYKADYNDPGTPWRQDPDFDDSDWTSGVSVFDGKQDTTSFMATPRTTVSDQTIRTQLPQRIPEGTTATNIPCYYFRSHFTLPIPASEIRALELFVFIDDFDVAWMNNNDTPVRKDPGNPLVNLDAFGYSGGTAVGTATNVGPFSISTSALRDGDNLICVKVFQQAVASSDISFGYHLVGVIDAFPPVGTSLSISQSGSTVTITWSDDSTLYQADSVDATGAAWTQVTGVGLSPGQYQFQAGSTAGAKFYTLRR